jgi:hypothetical protein
MNKLILIIQVTLIYSNVYSQEDVSLTVQGRGVNQEKARLSAFRSAIEQAFGVFVSSNTKVLNDELLLDEIVTLSNGNIKSYQILSEVVLPNNECLVSIKAIVSIKKLTSFIEKKGFECEFKGELFANNIKLQALNEASEKKVVLNLEKIISELTNTLFEYKINIIGDPYSSSGNNDNWNIPIELSIELNKGINVINDYVSNTLYGISMSKSEVENYSKLNKKVYALVIYNDLHNCKVNNYTLFEETADRFGFHRRKIFSSQNRSKFIEKKKNNTPVISCDHKKNLTSYKVIYFRNEDSRNIILSALNFINQKAKNFVINRKLYNKIQPLPFSKQSISYVEIFFLFKIGDFFSPYYSFIGQNKQDFKNSIFVNHYDIGDFKAPCREIYRCSYLDQWNWGNSDAVKKSKYSTSIDTKYVVFLSTNKQFEICYMRYTDNISKNEIEL